MKYKAAITRKDEHAPGLTQIIGFIEFSDSGHIDIDHLFELEDVIAEGYALAVYIEKPHTMIYSCDLPTIKVNC